METIYMIKHLAVTNLFVVTRCMWVEWIGESGRGMVRKFDTLGVFETRKEAKAFIAAAK